MGEEERESAPQRKREQERERRERERKKRSLVDIQEGKSMERQGDGQKECEREKRR